MKTSAGLLVYRRRDDKIEVLLGHIGGPWMVNKDNGAWSIPKGEYSNEDPKQVAVREFKEETGFDSPNGNWFELGTIKQKSGKQVMAWAVEGDYDASRAQSNMAKVEWPPRSGRTQEYPETDRMAWFDLVVASSKLVSGQVELLERLARKLGVEPPPPPPSQASLF